MTDSINPILAPLTADQVRIIELVASVYQNQRSWPPWQFIEQSMDKEGIDASSVLSTLPRLGSPNYAYGFSYGLTWMQGSPGSSPQPNDSVALTVAGLHRAGAMGYVKLFLQVLSLGCQKLRNFVPNPQQAVTLELTSAEVYAVLSDDLAKLLTPQEMYEFLEHEPAMWSGGRGMTAEGEWRWEITRPFKRYDNVTTIEEYIYCVTALVEEHAQQVARTVPFVMPTKGPLLAGLDEYADESDQHYLQPEVPLLGSGIDYELWEFVQPLVDSGRWEQVAREAAAFVETRARDWTGSKQDVHVLMSQLLKSAMGELKEAEERRQELNEAEGWHLLARGFFMAVRNHVMHNTVGVEEQFQYGLGALGTASLLVRRIRSVIEAQANDDEAQVLPGFPDASESIANDS
jgi:hypothetical protein